MYPFSPFGSDSKRNRPPIFNTTSIVVEAERAEETKLPGWQVSKCKDTSMAGGQFHQRYQHKTHRVLESSYSQSFTSKGLTSRSPDCRSHDSIVSKESKSCNEYSPNKGIKINRTPSPPNTYIATYDKSNPQKV